MMRLNMARDDKGINRKVRKFNAPEMLGKGRGSELKSSCPLGVSSGTFTSHNLIMYFGDAEYHEKNFSEDSCFLDILAICKRFIDVYSVGFKITDGDGRPLKSDQDVMSMIKEHKRVKDIHVYLEKDEMAQPLSFRMPQDNPNLGSCSYVIPKVINVKILGDLRANKKVLVEGDVIDGNEKASTAQLFMTSTKEFDDENGLEAISPPKTDRKEFQLPQEAVGHYLIAKYTPVNVDGKIGDSVFVVSEDRVENSDPRKVRGKNKNKAVACLKDGVKLEVTFYNYRAVSDNHTFWSRHLGKIVRDRNICPVRVQTWKDISKSDKAHMWAAVKECFSNPKIELYKDHTLEHMSNLWTNWRSNLNVDYVKPCKTREEALRNVPDGLDAKDWEWLVNNKFLAPKFMQISDRNAINRAGKTKMLHRTGSKPFREMIYQKGGKDDNPPDAATIFFETRKKGRKLVEPETINKYDQIVKTINVEPSLSEIELIEKCFGPQRHGHVFGYGGGIKIKNVKEYESAQVKELKAKLHEKDEEILNLRQTVGSILDRLSKIEKERKQSSSMDPSQSNDEPNKDDA